MTNKEKLILVLTILILAFVYIFGLVKMYFHQDDVDFLIAVAGNWPKTIWLPVNEHVVILFWLLYRLEWWLFGTNFAGYLTVSLLLHSANLFLAGWLVFEETKSRYYGLLTALVLAVNNNWNESIWWSTGQMWLLATLFCLLSLLLLSRRKYAPLLLIVAVLPGLSWGVGLIWPLILVLAFGVKGRLRWGLLASQGLLFLVYRLLAPAKALATLFSLELGQMAVFVVVGMANTVVGRLIFPWENKPLRVVVLAILLLFLLKTMKVWWPKIGGWPRQLIMASVLIYFTYSLGRAGAGVGQAMATRYAYLPTFLLAMAAVAVWAKTSFGKRREKLALALAVYLALTGLLVFYWRISAWTVRPGQVKAYFEKIRTMAVGGCLVDEPLPQFINPDPTKRLSDLKAPLGLTWRSGTAAQGCVLVPQ